MESVLKKFEKNAIDMSKICGAKTIYTGEMSAGTSGGAVYKGREYADIDADGCVWTYLIPYNGGGRIDGNFQC
jgi:hypothetical protein